MAALCRSMIVYVRGGHEGDREKVKKVKMNGVRRWSNKGEGVATTSVTTENGYIAKECLRQNIPTKKQYVDRHRQGLMIEQGVGYRQTIVIRSYEVGPDKTATLETILNLLQETALNHVWMSGLLGNGFGATHEMVRNNLIWVVSRMHVQIDDYPIWGEVVEIDTWVGASGKNGMRRDWVMRSQATGHIFARATSTWVMMNEKTRRLSKMPEEVRAEICPWFIEKQAIKEDVSDRIPKLNDNARFSSSNLKPKRSDLDMNHHVNNVKYVRWMLETIPDQILESHQLCGIILEFRKECGSSDTVEALCEADHLPSASSQDLYLLKTSFSLPSGILRSLPKRYTHLLRVKGDAENEEILRGRTLWNTNISKMPFSSY